MNGVSAHEWLTLDHRGRVRSGPRKNFLARDRTDIAGKWGLAPHETNFTADAAFFRAKPAAPPGRIVLKRPPPTVTGTGVQPDPRLPKCPARNWGDQVAWNGTTVIL